MRWSGVGLKGTLGSGGLGVLAVWVETAEPALYFWLLFVAVMVPFFILLFIRVDEVSPTLARNAHAVAVIWYLILVGGSIVFIVNRGPQHVDLLFAFFMLLGMLPCADILRNMIKGAYAAPPARRQD